MSASSFATSLSLPRGGTARTAYDEHPHRQDPARTPARERRRVRTCCAVHAPSPVAYPPPESDSAHPALPPADTPYARSIDVSGVAAGGEEEHEGTCSALDVCLARPQGLQLCQHSLAVLVALLFQFLMGATARAVGARVTILHSTHTCLRHDSTCLFAPLHPHPQLVLADA